MTYNLSWHLPQEVLRLELNNGITQAELEGVNREITDVLNQSQEKIALLIDASSLRASYQTVDTLRATQRYMDHPHLNMIVVFSHQKLIRLITMLAFSLGKARFVQFENTEASEKFITQSIEVKQKRIS